MENEDLKRTDQINLLGKCKKFTETGKWKAGFTYPDCGIDLVAMGLVREDKTITDAGKVALWLLDKGDDPTDSKAVNSFDVALSK